MKKVRWGILGAGGIADRRTMPGMLLADNAEIYAVMEINMEMAENLRAKYNAKFAYDNETDLLANPDIDAVYIASPVVCHDRQALAAAKAVFANGGVSANMPSTTLTDDNFTDGKITIIDMLVASGLAPSKGEARRLIQQGGVIAADEKIEAFDKAFDKDAFAGDGMVVKKGKKTFHRFTI